MMSAVSPDPPARRPLRPGDELVVVAIAVVAGVAAATAGARPTGSAAVDVAMVGVAAATVTWASATATWWATASAAGIGATIALDPLVAVVGIVGALGGLWVGWRQRELPVVQAVSGGIAVNVLLRSELDVFFGLSAIIGVATSLGLALVGLARRDWIVRRTAFVGVMALGVFLVAALAVAGISAFTARDDLRTANQQARDAVAAINDGRYDVAAELFEQSAAGFTSVEDRLGGVLAAPALLVPGVAQNLSAGSDLASAAGEAMGQAASAIRQVDPASFQLTAGAIDAERVRAAEAPLLELQEALVELREVADGLDSPWLLDRVRRELDELDDEFTENEPRLQNAIDVVRVAPAMLGADGERRYLLMFTTPAEARGLGGFVGNFAEVVVDDGAITVERFGRRSELQDTIEGSGARCDDCPQELLDFYGQFGLTLDPGGTVDGAAWQNITMPSHFPYVARSAASLYPQSGGVPVDGVIVMDAYVLEALMAYTGAVEIPQLGVTVEPDDAAEFILRDQYLLAADDVDSGDIDSVERIDALGTLGDEVVSRLLTGTLPQPDELADDLGPLVDERRLLVWTDDPAEQEVLRANHLLGELPAPHPTLGGFSVALSNAAGNKLDTWLERDVSVDVVEGPEGRQLVAEVTLTNGAPTSGYPDYVIGNVVDLPLGATRTFVVFYGPPTLVESSRDGMPFSPPPPATEAGWTAYSDMVELPAGESVTYRLVFDLGGGFGADTGTGDETDVASSTPVGWEQPLVRQES